MSEPKRVQRQRTKGWRMPPECQFVGRPTRWGHPFTIDRWGLELSLELFADLARGIWSPSRFDHVRLSAARDYDLDTAYRLHRAWRARLGNGHPTDIARANLGGLDLACWCRLDAECHGDTLLAVSNS